MRRLGLVLGLGILVVDQVDGDLCWIRENAFGERGLERTPSHEMELVEDYCLCSLVEGVGFVAERSAPQITAAGPFLLGMLGRVRLAQFWRVINSLLLVGDKFNFGWKKAYLGSVHYSYFQTCSLASVAVSIRVLSSVPPCGNALKHTVRP